MPMKTHSQDLTALPGHNRRSLLSAALVGVSAAALAPFVASPAKVHKAGAFVFVRWGIATQAGIEIREVFIPAGEIGDARGMRIDLETGEWRPLA